MRRYKKNGIEFIEVDGRVDDVPVTGELSSETTPEDWERFRRRAGIIEKGRRHDRGVRRN